MAAGKTLPAFLILAAVAFSTAAALATREPGWGVIGATVAIAVATLVLASHTASLHRQTRQLSEETSALARFTKRLADLEERRQILEEMAMYQDVKEGNVWNWAPGDVGVNDERFADWDAWRRRCISYAARVLSTSKDPTTKVQYPRFVDMAKQGRVDRDAWNTALNGARDAAEHEIVRLRDRLSELESRLGPG